MHQPHSDDGKRPKRGGGSYVDDDVVVVEDDECMGWRFSGVHAEDERSLVLAIPKYKRRSPCRLVYTAHIHKMPRVKSGCSSST